MKLDLKLKPEDKPKLIGIGFAILGALIYLLVTLIPKLSPPQTKPVEEGGQTVSAAGGPGHAATVGPSKDMEDLDSDVVPQTPYKEIFAPPVGSAKPPEKGDPTPYSNTVSSGNPAAQVATGRKSGLSSFKSMSEQDQLRREIPMDGPPGPIIQQGNPGHMSQSGGGGQSGGIVVPIPAASPAVLLSGVIVGENPVAVIVINGVTYYKRKGDIVSGNLRILSIQASGVTLQVGTKKMTVDVGHTLPSISATTITVVSTPADTPEALAAAMKQEQSSGVTKIEAKAPAKH